MKYKSISVFLPVLNEQENVKSCVLAVQKYIQEKFRDYEIIVVVNGSTDDTANIVQKLAKKDKRIKLVNENKRGYGVALRAGFAKSSKELIFYTDGDNQFDIKEMDKLFPLLNKYDVISAYRIKRKDPPMRIFVANVYNIIINVLFNPGVRDVDSSFKLYKKKVIDKLKLESKTGLIDAEVLIKAKKQGFKIGQIGVKHYPRMNGQTIYATANKNNMFVFVKPKVVIDILKEIKTLWADLR